MSHDNPFTDPTDGSDPTPQGFNPQELTALREAFANVDFRVQHAEPIVRDLNRNIIETLGQCPNTDTGNWVTLEEDGSVRFHLLFTDVIRLSTAFQEIARKVELAEVRKGLPRRKTLGQYLADLSASKKNIAPMGEFHRESVHIIKRRGTGYFGKGK